MLGDLLLGRRQGSEVFAGGLDDALFKALHHLCCFGYAATADKEARRFRQAAAPPEQEKDRYGRDNLGPAPTVLAHPHDEPANQRSAHEAEGEEAGQGSNEPTATLRGNEL